MQGPRPTTALALAALVGGVLAHGGHAHAQRAATAVRPAARAAPPAKPKPPVPGGPVKIRVSPSGRIEPVGAAPPAPSPPRPAPAPKTPSVAPAAPPAAPSPGGQPPTPRPPAASPAGPASPLTHVPTRTLDNPFSLVELAGPLPPALAGALARLPPPVAEPPPPTPAPPAPSSAAAAQGQPLVSLLNVPPARPHFIEGDLESFVLRPMTRRNFVGVGAGMAAIPNDANTLLNTFFITIEPQIDVVNEKFGWKLGLGAPLNLRLLDTRGPFEGCIDRARSVRDMGGNEDLVAAETSSCLLSSRDEITEGIGTLRQQDWDEASDYAKVLRYFTVGRPEGEFYMNISRIFDQSLSHGTVVRDYNANINFNTTRLGATLDFNRAAIGLQGIANDLVRPDVLGLMLFVRPFRPFSESVLLRSLSLGVTYAHGVNQPRRLLYEAGLFAPTFGKPIPLVDEELNMVGAAYAPMDVYGLDLEAKLVRLSENDLKVYVDFQRMQHYGSGATLGALFRYSHGQPATQALRARAEVNYFTADFLPSYFDTYHDIFQYQYLPATYRASNGLLYSPTKLQYLEAARGGPPRIGGYFEISHALIDRLTLSVAGRFWRPVGSAKDTLFNGLRFPDYDETCRNPGDGDLDCEGRSVVVADSGFSSLRLRAELPFRKFLQAFVSYEVFSSGDEDGLGLFRLQGDNELLFGGARLMLLPFLFFQAETRRYFFLQRVSNIDLETATVQQDQRYHANWTFAFSTYVGYEF